MPPRTKKGKENVPKKKDKLEVEEIEDNFDEMEDLDPPPVKRGRPLKTKKTVSAEPEPEPELEEPRVEKQVSSKHEKGDDALRRRLATITVERDRAVKERETYIKQFEELSRLRESQQEALLEKFKEQTAAVAKAQADVIANQTTLNDKLMAKVSELEKALASQREATQRAEDKAAAAEAPPVLEGKLDGKSSKELHNEVFKLRNTLKTKEEELTRIQREYEQEVAHSRKLQREQRPSVEPAAAVTAAAPSSEESEKDQASLKLYEDLTGLSILRVNIKRGVPGGKEVLFNCMQTWDDRSFGFKVRAYNSLDRESKRWIKQLEFSPEGIENEKDKAFVQRLGPFVKGFLVPVDQGLAAWEQLRTRVSRKGVYDEPQVVY